MLPKNHSACILLIFLCALAALVSCSTKQSYLVSCIADKEIRAEQEELISLLGTTDLAQETAFTLKNRIAANLAATGNTSALAVFLTSDATGGGSDPYAAYWLLMAADVYMKQNSPEIAAYYFEQILDNCNDLTVKGNSIHQICLQNLIGISHSPQRLIQYYTDYIRQFPQEKNISEFYFMLARAYEQTGEWEMAIQSYTKFLQQEKYDVAIPGIPDSYAYARRLIDYNNSSKDWTFATLDELVASIKRALDSYDTRTLERYMAKVNFFAMSWEQNYTAVGIQESEIEFRISDFMRGNRITYDAQLDPDSTPYEAYLRTSGWSQYVAVWYLYFRKVNFPADPETHGRWEWAGIYYGEKI